MLNSTDGDVQARMVGTGPSVWGHRDSPSIHSWIGCLGSSRSKAIVRSCIGSGLRICGGSTLPGGHLGSVRATFELRRDHSRRLKRERHVGPQDVGTLHGLSPYQLLDHTRAFSQATCVSIHETELHVQVTFDRITSNTFPTSEIDYEHH